jgi:hypothetical protein
VKDIEHIKMTSSNLERGDDDDEKEKPQGIVDEGDLDRETKKRFEERLSINPGLIIDIANGTITVLKEQISQDALAKAARDIEIKELKTESEMLRNDVETLR